MSLHSSASLKRITTHTLQEMKQRGEKISMLTAYDFSMAKIVDAAGMDIILVGDSASNVMAGHETTLPITLDQMIYHASAVVRAVKRSFVGVPVMGHLGLTPQSIYKFGTYAVRAKEEEEAEKLVEDAKLLEACGCFALVLEKIPAVLAKRVAEALSIPVIGIGAGADVDGQVLVMHDMLGITQEFKPRFLRAYADLNQIMTQAFQQYISDVKTKDFPNSSESY